MKILITILTGLMVLMGCSEKKSHIENSSFNEEIEYSRYLDSVLRDSLFPAAVCGCTPGNREYSDVRKAPWLYPTGDGKFTTFERYMWDGGFPDTIIVRFTRDGEFEGYVEAVRQGVLEDSLGNYCSPTYVFMSMVGDSWTYDINGRFLEFSCADLPHSGHPHTYHP